MPAIVRSAALICAVAVFAIADAHDDVMEVLGKMAAGLTGDNSARGAARGGNVAEFMSGVSKEMPEYDMLKSNVTALVRGSEISSSIRPLAEDAQRGTYKVDLDWLLQIRSLQQAGQVVRRREVVHCVLREEDKQWKVVGLTPLDFFAAPKPGP